MQNFTVYQNDNFALKYSNENHKEGFTHLLSVYDTQTDKEITGMWIDPTASNSKAFNAIQRLKSLQGTNSYNQEVAHFLEYLINNAGFSSLKISSLMKEALRHHSNPAQLINTIKSVDLSKANFRNEDRISEVFNVEELIAQMKNFIESIKDFVNSLFGQEEQQEAEAKGTLNTSSRNRFYKPGASLEVGASTIAENNQTHSGPDSPQL